MQDELNPIEDKNLSQSIIDEDNKKVRNVIRKIEDLNWTPYTQRKVKLYCDCGITRYHIVDTNSKGEKFNERTSFTYLHYELNKELFSYRDVINKIIRNYDYNFSIRKKIIIFLGCRCVYCGNEDIDYLHLDHKKNNGNEERREFKRRGLNLMLYYWENLIDAYLRLQILCIKCHKLKSSFRLSQKDIDDKISNNIKIELEVKEKKDKEIELEKEKSNDLINELEELEESLLEINNKTQQIDIKKRIEEIKSLLR